MLLNPSSMGEFVVTKSAFKTCTKYYILFFCINVEGDRCMVKCFIPSVTLTILVVLKKRKIKWGITNTSPTLHNITKVNLFDKTSNQLFKKKKKKKLNHINFIDMFFLVYLISQLFLLI